jgi:hypothetical protein
VVRAVPEEQNVAVGLLLQNRQNQEGKNMPKFCKKPVVIEARQYDGKNGIALLSWIGGSELEEDFLGDGIEIKTIEGTMIANKGDWIIKGVMGEFYPCKPKIFEATYDPVV